MTVPRSGGRLALLSATWLCPEDEAGFAARSIAGAASRLLPVDVFVPGAPGSSVPDGAFDRVSLGEPSPGHRWPEATHVAPVGDGSCRAVLVDERDDEALGLAERLWPGAPVLGIGSRVDAPPATGRPIQILSVGMGGPEDEVQRVGVYVPVNPFAAERPHSELGSVDDYLVILSDRTPEAADPERPSDEVAWLVARFPRRHVVVIENAIASVWRSRSLSRRFAVHTRMDLWRLLAFAWATVDLLPGGLFARECVESLRYGVPVVVPAGTAAAELARRGAGCVFNDLSDLLGCVEALEDPAERGRLAPTGRALADNWYGDPGGLVTRLGTAFASVAGPLD